EITLADQLFTARVANAVEQLAAAIPADTKPSAVIEVARVTFGELFAVGTAPRAPEANVTVDEKKKTMEIVIRPHGFVGVQLEEIALGAPLSGWPLLDGLRRVVDARPERPLARAKVAVLGEHVHALQLRLAQLAPAVVVHHHLLEDLDLVRLELRRGRQ